MTTQGGRNPDLANEEKTSIRGERAGKLAGHTRDEGAYAREGKVRGHEESPEEQTQDHSR